MPRFTSIPRTFRSERPLIKDQAAAIPPLATQSPPQVRSRMGESWSILQEAGRRESWNEEVAPSHRRPMNSIQSAPPRRAIPAALPHGARASRPLPKQSGASSATLIVSLLTLAYFLLPSPAPAANPPWWSDSSTRIIDPTAPQPENYAPVNLGQLKHVASKARTYLDTVLASVGGAGPAIDSLADSFVTQQGAPDPDANYTLANLGQLKAIAKPFYDRLIAIGYDTKANLVAHGYPAQWAFATPWNSDTPVEENYAGANIGQLKMIFSFDLTGFDLTNVDADKDNLKDQFEVSNGLDPFDPTGDNGEFGDPDGDKVNNRDEQTAGTNPKGPPADQADTDGDGMIDTTEEGRGAKIGSKDHPDLNLQVIIQVN